MACRDRSQPLPVAAAAETGLPVGYWKLKQRDENKVLRQNTQGINGGYVYTVAAAENHWSL